MARNLYVSVDVEYETGLTLENQEVKRFCEGFMENGMSSAMWLDDVTLHPAGRTVGIDMAMRSDAGTLEMARDTAMAAKEQLEAVLGEEVEFTHGSALEGTEFR